MDQEKIVDEITTSTNEQAVITYFKEKKDGRMSYFYQFQKDNIDYTKYFAGFGRMTKRKGISYVKTEKSPSTMHSVLTSFAVSISNIGPMAGAQREIDICNKKSGCNSCCSQAARESCGKLQYHRELLDINLIVHEIKATPLDAYVEK